MLGNRPYAILDNELVEDDITLTETLRTRYEGARETRQHTLAIALIENAFQYLKSSNNAAAWESALWFRGYLKDGVQFAACCDALNVDVDVMLKRLGENMSSKRTSWRSFQ